MDFKPIIPMLNTEKYKWLSYDPPGYGKSRPPKREFQSKYGSVYALDVPYIKEIMEVKFINKKDNLSRLFVSCNPLIAHSTICFFMLLCFMLSLARFKHLV